MRKEKPNGIKFEEDVANVFNFYGFTVRHNYIINQNSKKNQIDILVESNGKIIAVECKYHNYLSDKELEEIMANLKFKASLLKEKPVYLLVVTKNNTLIKDDKIVAISYKDLPVFLKDFEINKLFAII